MRLSDDKKTEIRIFLKSVKKMVDSASTDVSKIIVANRQEFIDTITFFGWKMDDVLDILYNLTISDYRSGPEVNRNHPGAPLLWIFLYPYYGHELYIKISVGIHTSTQEETLFILSFHK